MRQQELQIGRIADQGRHLPALGLQVASVAVRKVASAKSRAVRRDPRQD